MFKRFLLFVFFGLYVTSGTAAAQSLRLYMIEMDRRLDMIEQRLDALEADGARRADAERAKETERQRAAVLELARQCANFRNDQTRVDAYKACMAQRARGDQMSPRCTMLELDELSCH